MFMEALKTQNAVDNPLFGDLKPDDSVNLYFNMSYGPDADQRGPWDSEPAFQYVADPLQHERQQHGNASQYSNEMAVTPSAGAPPRESLQPAKAPPAPQQKGH